MKDLKLVYQAVSKEAAETELLNLDAKWGEQYPIVIKSWQDNWEKLTEYFQFTAGIRMAKTEHSHPVERLNPFNYELKIGLKTA